MGKHANAHRRPKPKSIKSKKVNGGSKRRLAKFGKEQKKGHAGTVVHYMTRTKAIKYLQITLRDFRRLCILKGIYPREPKKKLKNKDKTYYHVKDISYLAHEPLLGKFREFKVFMKKVRKRLAKKEHGDANKMYEQRPEYTLDHLVKERYPRFVDAIADLDDALCLLHLFAVMPAIGTIRTERTDACARLCREWQLYVAKSRSLRKTFVSVKGIYYEAEIQGQKVVWLVPHKFSQDMPRDVDYRTMLTFLEFYETLLGFVMFKLYHNLGLVYPPKVSTARDADGDHLKALLLENKTEQEEADEVDEDEDAMDEDDSNDGEQRVSSRKNKISSSTKGADAPKSATEKKSEKRIKSLESKLSTIEDEPEDAEVVNANQDDDEEMGGDFDQDDEVKALKAHQKHVHALTHLFSGLTFFLGREVPFETLEFIILSLGGKVRRQDVDDETDTSITHQVTDRPAVGTRVASREYVQPQWVFDSVNNSFLLPVERYTIGATLPPHLSPFVDNDAEGHTPTYAADIQKLKEQRGDAAVTQKGQLSKEFLPEKTKSTRAIKDVQEDDEAAENSDDEEGVEEKYARELREELRGSKDDASDDESESEDESEDEEEESDEEEEEAPKPKKKTDKKEAAGKAEAKKKAQQEEAKKKKAAVEAEAQPKKDALFISSSKFKGAKPGYIFKKGSKGTGYYKDKQRKVTFKGYSGLSKRSQRKKEMEEEHARRQMMMSKKSKRLYDRMQYGLNKKKAAVDKLKRKRDEIEGSAKKRGKKVRR